MEKTDNKLELENSKVVVKKRREDFMVLTADVSTLEPQARAACDLIRAAIFQEMGLAPPSATAFSTPTATTYSAPTATLTTTPNGKANDDDSLGRRHPRCGLARCHQRRRLICLPCVLRLRFVMAYILNLCGLDFEFVT